MVKEGKKEEETEAQIRGRRTQEGSRETEKCVAKESKRRGQGGLEKKGGEHGDKK